MTRGGQVDSGMKSGGHKRAGELQLITEIKAEASRDLRERELARGGGVAHRWEG